MIDDPALSSLVQFWRRLSATIHPDDATVFTKFFGRHTFNLDYPPPAFVGNVDQAPVIILMANGGFDPERTPAEFVDPQSISAYLNRLHNPGPVDNWLMSKYYTTKVNYGRWLIDGSAALVNVIAYRSPRLSEEPSNQRLVPFLPSVRMHRQWLIEELLPQAKIGRRLVVAHRSKYWNLDKSQAQGVVWSTNSRSPYLSRDIIDAIEQFLKARDD